MATTPLPARTRDQIRADILRTMDYGYRTRGVTAPNVGYGSDDYVWANAVATEIEPVYPNTQAAADAQMPDTAVDEDLDRQLAMVGLARRAAGPSTGVIRPLPTSASSVPAGSQLTDPNGKVFTVVAGGAASATSPGTMFTIQSQDTGTAANLAAGTVMKWVTPPPYMSATVALYGAATGGTDAEANEAARSRLLSFYESQQSSGGAYGMVKSIAEASSPEIQAAFVYPAANGPGTEHVAVMGYWSTTFYRPTVTDPSVSLATSAVQNELPEYVESVITSVQEQECDLAFRLILPSALTAIPAGTGGGWVDAIPFPVVADAAGTSATNQRCRVLSVTSTTSISVESMQAGAVDSSIAWIDAATFTIVTAKITGITETLAPSGSTMGQYAITLDTPLVGSSNVTTPGSVAVNDFVFPAATNQANYLAAILATFASMGPGEKVPSSATAILPRAYRQPRPSALWPYALDGRFTAALTGSGTEVQQATYAWQDGTPSTTPPVPATPALISDGAFCFVPKRLGWYPA